MSRVCSNKSERAGVHLTERIKCALKVAPDEQPWGLRLHMGSSPYCRSMAVVSKGHVTLAWVPDLWCRFTDEWLLNCCSFIYSITEYFNIQLVHALLWGILWKFGLVGEQTGIKFGPRGLKLARSICSVEWASYWKNKPTTLIWLYYCINIQTSCCRSLWTNTTFNKQKCLWCYLFPLPLTMTNPNICHLLHMTWGSQLLEDVAACCL